MCKSRKTPKQTGTPLSSAQVVFISLAIIAVGFVIFNKKEEIA